MSRPPAVSNDVLVDANACAVAQASRDRSFTAEELPRLAEAGVGSNAPVRVHVRFSVIDGRPAIDGALKANVVMTCQRCLKPLEVPIDDHFQVLIVDAERSDEPSGYEPVVADAARFDLRWLVEEQILLALPLAPMHEQLDCHTTNVEAPAAEQDAADARQRPFENLRNMLREP